jgi:hypothetical protein
MSTSQAAGSNVTPPGPVRATPAHRHVRNNTSTCTTRAHAQHLHSTALCNTPPIRHSHNWPLFQPPTSDRTHSTCRASRVRCCTPPSPPPSFHLQSASHMLSHLRRLRTCSPQEPTKRRNSLGADGRRLSIGDRRNSLGDGPNRDRRDSIGDGRGRDRRDSLGTVRSGGLKDRRGSIGDGRRDSIGNGRRPSVTNSLIGSLAGFTETVRGPTAAPLDRALGPRPWTTPLDHAFGPRPWTTP